MKDVEKAVEQVKKGKVEIKLEPNGKSIHTIIGKKSFDNKALVENFREIFTALDQNKPAKAGSDWIKSIYITTSMSPSVQVDLIGL